jgi:type IV secretory pathway TrbD component
MGTLLMLVAAVLFLIAGLVSADIISGVQAHTLAYFGLCAWATAILIGGAGPIIERIRQ